MKQKRIRQIERRIDRIKTALLEIGAMRPGSLTRQYKDPQHHAGASWQISYTRRMKSRTEYVRREWVKNLRRQIANHKRFKSLVEQWIDLSIEHSQLTMQVAELKATSTYWNSVLSSKVLLYRNARWRQRRTARNGCHCRPNFSRMFRLG